MSVRAGRAVTAAAIVAAEFAATGGSEARAAQYPERPIRLVMPFPPGGGADVASRFVALALSEIAKWGKVVREPGIRRE